MELISNPQIKSSDSWSRPVFLSVFFHLAIITFIIFFPRFHSSQRIVIPAMDISLYDLPPGNLGGGSPVNSKPAKAEVPKEKPQEPVKEPKPEPPKKSELMDPSENELSKMKRRTEDWTPAPKKNVGGSEGGAPLGKDFPMGNFGIPGGKGKGSGSLSLDTGAFPYMYYLVMMKNRISENWIPPFGSMTAEESKRVVIAFRIDRFGVVSDARVEEGSANENLDSSALRAVTVSSPFPPLPENYPDSTLGVHFGFRFEL
jgi:periplasmic protein TonB